MDANPGPWSTPLGAVTAYAFAVFAGMLTTAAVLGGLDLWVASRASVGGAGAALAVSVIAAALNGPRISAGQVPDGDH